MKNQKLQDFEFAGMESMASLGIARNLLVVERKKASDNLEQPDNY